MPSNNPTMATAWYAYQKLDYHLRENLTSSRLVVNDLLTITELDQVEGEFWNVTQRSNDGLPLSNAQLLTL